MQMRLLLVAGLTGLEPATFRVTVCAEVADRE